MILNKYFNGITYLILLGISIRLIVVIVNYLTGYNSFIGPDSYGLHHTAVMLSKKDFSFIISQKFHLHNFYLFIAPLFYKISPFNSYTFGSLISILCWFVSILLCLHTMKMLKVKKNFVFLGIFLLCFWPSLILFTAAVSREAFQILFVCASILLTIKTIISKKKIYLFFLILVSLVLSLLHKAFFFFSLWNLTIAFFSLISLKFLKSKTNIIISLGLVLILTVLIQNYENYGYKQFAQGLPQAVEIYQNGLLINSEARANMRTYPVSIFDYPDLSVFVFIAIYDYFTQPIISKIFSFGDLLAFIENILRIVLILLSFIFYFKIKNLNKKYILYLFLTFFFIETVWALGTSNWGTALRHHTTAIPVLVIFFLSFFTDHEYRTNKKIKFKEHAKQ